MLTRIVAIVVFLSQVITSFSLGVLNTRVDPVNYGGTPRVEPVITKWLTLIKGGESDYVIVKGAACTPSEATAARELQTLLQQISGKRLELVEDTARVRDKEILVGKTNREGDGYTIDRAALGDEGFAVMVRGQKLIIAGGELRGTLYGVYTFLEEQLDCRWFTPKVSVIPNSPTVRIDAVLNYTQTPVFEYRYEDWRCSLDEAWRVKQKINDGASSPAYGGSVFYANGCHSMDSLVPLSLFDEHPEYFSYREDTGTWTTHQRCLTNPAVLAVTIANVRAALRAAPRAQMVSITQNDNGAYCQCPHCKASDALYGGPSGTNIWFVNQVAAALEAEFPQVEFDTFAYQYTRTPPKNVVPRSNVVVRLCSIECCFSHPLAEYGTPRLKPEDIQKEFPYIRVDSPWDRTKAYDPSFANDLKGWSEICEKLYVWDYTTNFLMYLNLFANFHVLADNLQFFAEHNVRGVFEEGNLQSESGEFGELRAYLLAKLMWDPYADVEAHMDDFLAGYYGAEAGAYIKEYINIITNKTLNTHQHIYIFQWQNETPYFTKQERRHIDALWDAAEAAAENDRQRDDIRRSRLSWRFHKGNQLLDEFSYLNPLRHYRENERLYNDIKDLGITYLTLGGPLSQTPNFWLTPADWMTD